MGSAVSIISDSVLNEQTITSRFLDRFRDFLIITDVYQGIVLTSTRGYSLIR